MNRRKQSPIGVGLVLIVGATIVVAFTSESAIADKAQKMEAASPGKNVKAGGVMADFPLPPLPLANDCVCLEVSLTGEMSADAEGCAFNFLEDCDTFNVHTHPETYLFDGGPIITRVNEANDTVLFTAFLHTFFTYPDSFIVRSDFTIDSNPSFVYATHMLMTRDSMIGLQIEYWLPKSSDSCTFLIKQYRLFNLTQEFIPGIVFGEGLDWDVPTDSPFCRNGSGFEESRRILYQFGVEYNQDDSTEALCGQQSNDRFAGIDPWTFSPMRNAYTRPLSSYWDPGEMSAGRLYREMKTTYGVDLYQSSDPDEQYVDLISFTTFDEYDLGPGDTECVTMIMAVGKEGEADFIASMDKARAFIVDHAIACVPNCCVRPGDGNGDEAIDIADVVFLINYIFKGGPPPPCRNAADVNNDCMINLADAIFILRSIFIPIWPSPLVCGSPLCLY